MSAGNSGQPSNRSQRARSELSHDRTTGTLRSEFRSRFFTRLRVNRSRSVDRLRQIVEDYGEMISYRSVNDLRMALERDPEASNLLRDTEVNEVLNQIEQELAHVDLEDQAERHELERETETEDIVNRHMIPCRVCQNLSIENICATCTSQFKDEFEK
ncbi:hypothetical protein JTB14_004382 [Gonioctena quinquepunctata]|nr:hypothetical protein JTB14_004382 [Gonioctena quinquepunctata]